MKQGKRAAPVLRLRLSVKNVRPEIWRTLVVSADTTLARLHDILQVLMGWQGHHLYAFSIDGKRYAPADENTEGGEKGSPLKAKLSSVLTRKTELITYEYDFGDGWEVELRKGLKDDAFQQKQPAECIEGLRRGPVEDSGGSRGYMEKVDIYRNPQHKRFREIRTWMGPDFDAEAFDLAGTNELLRKIG